MKTEFTLNAYVARMLSSNGYNVDGIRNAVKSARNDLQLLKPEETKGGTLKLKPGKGETGEATVSATETTKATYGGKANTPLAFGAWNDAMTAMGKTHGDPSGELTPDIMPALLRFWTDAKFLSAELRGKDTTKPEGNGRAVTPESKGKGKGNRIVTPESTPAPAPQG